MTLGILRTSPGTGVDAGDGERHRRKPQFSRLPQASEAKGRSYGAKRQTPPGACAGFPTGTFMLDPSATTGLFRLAFGACALAASALPAFAEGRLSAKYAFSLAGVELGRGSIVVEANDGGYEIAGSARVSGVARAVSSGKGSAAARGAVTPGKLVPRVYAMSAEADGEQESVRLAMVSGNVKDLDVEPPLKWAPDRVQVVDANLQNVVDPMSAAFIYVPGPAEMLSPAACDRSIPVFDGRQRYDVELSFLRKENVKAKEGYSGPAIVCRIRYVPVAGHRPSRSTVKYMMENKEMYVWLVPISGTRFMAPFKISVATMIGTAVLEATSFVTEDKTQGLTVAPKP